jgi:hypothetical protein
MGAGSAGVVVMNGREAGWSGLSGLSGCLVERARSLREQKIGTGVLPIWQLLFSPLLLYSRGGLIGLPLRASNDHDYRWSLRARLVLSKGVAKVALDCAHFLTHPPRACQDAPMTHASTVLSCAFCEQGGHLAAPAHRFHLMLQPTLAL